MDETIPKPTHIYHIRTDRDGKPCMEKQRILRETPSYWHVELSPGFRSWWPFKDRKLGMEVERIDKKRSRVFTSWAAALNDARTSAMAQHEFAQSRLNDASNRLTAILAIPDKEPSNG